MNISSGAVRDLTEILRRWDAATRKWHASTDYDPHHLDRVKFDIILAGSELVGYLKGTLDYKDEAK